MKTHSRTSLATSLAAVALTCLAPSLLHGAERFWVNSAGGTFTNTANWSAADGGLGGSTAPVAADSANFTLNYTYTVNFSTGATNTDFDVEDGTVTFDLSGFTYSLTNTTAAEIGRVPGKPGRLTVREGILAVDTQGDDLFIGVTQGSTGFLTVTTGGRIGNGTIRPDLFVGFNGTGTLTVNDNGRIDAGAFTAGTGTGRGAGTVTITGPNAVVNALSLTTVGATGAGTVSVNNGGTLTTASAVELGDNLGADGAVTVSGAGSSWTISGSSTIGDGGDGALTISSGGLVSSAAVSIGAQATGSGTATVTGTNSRWNLSAAQEIGFFGLGVVTVSSGGHIAGTSFATLGSGLGSEGRVTITGAGSEWALSTLVAGNSGTGDLTVSSGGEVSASSVVLGNTSTGIGVVTVTGTGSKLTSGGGLSVSVGGAGTLNVASGAEVYVGSNLTVSDPAGAPTGTLNLDGGSIFVAGNFTNNGNFNFTDGLLQVRGNFQPSAAAAPLAINGDYNGDLPTLDLIGTGTTTNVTNVIVGSNRRGQLLLRQGRVLTVGAFTSSIGTVAGGEGTLSVQSGAQFLSSSTLSIGGVGGIVGGTGTLDVSGGTVDVSTLELFRDGTVNLSSGTLAFNTVTILDGQFNWTGGTLRFDSAFTLSGSNAKFLGLDGTLDAGQALTTAAALWVDTPVIVDGGALNAGHLVNNSVFEIRSGSATVGVTILNTAGAQLFVERNLSFGSSLTNEHGARLELVGGTGRLLGAGFVGNNGLITGDGTITNQVANGAAGRIRVDAGKTLFFTGGLLNEGELNLQGGTLDFTTAITNSATGFITGRGALFTGGLTNNGQMAFSGGNADIFGDVTLTAGSRVATSGAGSVTAFWDDVTHNGTEIFTGASCSTVFFGAQSGAGSYTGSGTIYFIGDLRPGSSPAAISFAPQVVFESSNSLTLEIGGTAPGTQHDKLSFTHAASPQVEWGGALTITLINGFTPAAGNAFDVLDFDAARDAGAFSSITLPALPGGLTWDTTQLYTTGVISVVPPGLTFAQWAATVLGNPSATPGGDHDNDGYDNGVEFTLGLFPPQPGTVLPNGGFFTYPDGERLRVLFTRLLDRTGVTLKVQVSTNLTTWDDLAVSVDSAPFTGPGFVSENRAHPLSEPGLVEVRDTVNTSAGARRYIRLQVTLAP